MTEGLKAFRAADFGWTRQLRSVWRDPPYHVAAIHQEILDDLMEDFEQRTRDPNPLDEPIGRVILGPAGFGKTHLMGELRRRVWEKNGWFILLDLVGVKDFWTSVALGFLNSLEVRISGDDTQYDRLVRALAELLGIQREMLSVAKRHRGQPRELVSALVDLFVRSLSKRYFHETGAHRDVVIALILLISEDLDCHSIAHAWLQGMTLDAELVRPFGIVGLNDPQKVVRGLSWIMSLVGPTLIGVDQIDAILSAANSRPSSNSEEAAEAQSIVEALSQGLMDLHEMKRRAITVVSCLEATWKILEKRASAAVTDRYNPPVILRSLANSATGQELVAARLQQAYHARAFKPPYSSWPFAPAAFAQVSGYSPRQLLKACEAHRLRCVANGVVSECTSFDSDAAPQPSPPQHEEIDKAFARAIAAADTSLLLSESGEDAMRELFIATLELFARQLDLPDDTDVTVQRDPDQRRPSLHGRLSFVFHREDEREEHYCFRILEKSNPIAFQSRLKAAMTASGIDTSLKFRHLIVLRNGALPGGVKTKEVLDQFHQSGGKFIAPIAEDLRLFLALQALAGMKIEGFDAWLLRKKPLFEAKIFQAAGLCPPTFLAKNSADPATSPPAAAPETAKPQKANKTAKIASEKAVKGQSPLSAVHKAAAGMIALGHRAQSADPVYLPAAILPRHMAVIAGPGSGKTVLLRRLIEEAVLLDIPSLVLDVNNDLSRLGDAWPERPASFSDHDAAAAAAYRERADVVIWTPGINSGNPVSLNLLPDFSSIGLAKDAQSRDELELAVDMARATLAPLFAASGKKAGLLQGVLADALRKFASGGGGSLDDLTALLAALPEGTSKISNAEKMASEIADSLLAAMATNPLLRPGLSCLDPQKLFYGAEGRTRVSVINLCGLASDEAKQAFVNQLQMTLFTWIKQNPSPTGRLYVLDEAQNFVPATSVTTASASAAALAAQARKYGLGMVFATQLPKGIDNGIVSNCTTHVYGRMSSPNTIQAVRELMAAKGGAADDIGRLSRGEFYFSTEGYERPVMIRTPLCLSWHPQNPPTAEEIVRKARLCRGGYRSAE